MKKIAPPGRRGTVKREAFKAEEAVKIEEISVSAKEREGETPTNNSDSNDSVTGAVVADCPGAAIAAAELRETLRAVEEKEREKEIVREREMEAEKEREKERQAAAAAAAASENAHREREAAEAATAAAALEAEREKERERERETAIAAAAVAALELERTQERERERLAAEAERERERQRLLLEEERRRERDAAEERARQEAQEAEEIARRAETERERLRSEKEREIAAERERERAERERERERAEEQRRKRASFLSDMQSFSAAVETHTQQREETLSQAQRKHSELAQSDVLATPVAVQIERETLTHTHTEKEKEHIAHTERETESPVATSVVHTVLEKRETPAVAPAVPHTETRAAETKRQPEPESVSVSVDKSSATAGRTKIDSLARSLFGDDNTASSSNGDSIAAAFDASVSVSAAVVAAAAPPVAVSSPQAKAETVKEAEAEKKAVLYEEEELRVPTRIGNKQSKSKSKFSSATAAAAVSVPEREEETTVVSPSLSEKSTSDKRASATVSPVPTPATTVENSNNGEDGEGEEGTGGLSNLLTREERRAMTTDQKASWRAKQADLTTRRRDFHGAVTYMFDGVFSWQMYGSAEAVDEYGNSYTEYLMRCQWGTNFDNLQPWIVAHRYREFDSLDQTLKKQFPHLEKQMPQLPKKEMLFRSLDSGVVSKRRQVLEEYMSRIVESMPTILRSETLNAFLRIQERITTIKHMLRLQEAVVLEVAAPVEHTGSSATAASSSVSAATTTAAAAAGTAEESGAQRRRSVKFGGDAAKETEPEEEVALIWSVDEAERLKAVLNAQPFDEDGMGRMEEHIKQFAYLLRSKPPKETSNTQGEHIKVLKAISKDWPRLRATAVVDMNVDFTLIPRAMQAEEDLCFFINQYRNMLAARQTRR